ncbi:unnamed protein product [Lactuca virosa]|uniref:Uncharacterized protein n=1 Tax=Lactuca virosa TaxID=75947 RepID=A0AAU9LWH7_9ASTR|nr:unnamed protein product [Lactuca virosa]
MLWKRVATTGIPPAKHTLTWTKLVTNGELLRPRAGHTNIALGKNLFVFGGFTDAEDLYNDLYMFDLVIDRMPLRGVLLSNNIKKTVADDFRRCNFCYLNMKTPAASNASPPHEVSGGVKSSLEVNSTPNPNLGYDGESHPLTGE